MSPHLIVWRSHTQTLLWPASGAGWPVKGLEVASPDHQVGALFEALDEAQVNPSVFRFLACPWQTVGTVQLHICVGIGRTHWENPISRAKAKRPFLWPLFQS